MVNHTEDLKPVKIRNVPVGHQTTLDAGTPNGLFEADNGNLYLVTHDDDEPVDCKFAIVLRHPDLKGFTSLELTSRKLEQGIWHGAYRLRLYHSFGGEAPIDRPGYVCVSYDGLVVLNCRGEKHHPSSIMIGNISEKRGGQICLPKTDWRDFDGWEVVPTGFKRSIFNRAPAGQRAWVINVKPLKPSSN